jgi:hypothetical protein
VFANDLTERGSWLVTSIQYHKLRATSNTSRQDALLTAASWFASMNASHNRIDTRRDPGMHVSATTDYVILLKGEITLVLDDEVPMKPFDTVVQLQTNHAWRNDGTETALLLAALVDEPHRG